MTTTTFTTGPQHAHAPALVATAGIPFRRLLRVELRKLHDTRAGLGLLVTIGLITAVAVGVTFAVGDPADLTFFTFVSATALPQGLLLPILGILAVTGEWSQRTTMTTFVIEPRRARVAAAKLVAVTAFALLAVVAALAVGAVANLAAIAFRGADGSWSLDAGIVGGAVLVQLIAVTMGVAFGMAILQSTLAIVGYLLLPTAWTFATALVPSLDPVARWLDLSRTESPLFSGEVAGSDWLRLGVSLLVWIGVPLALGLRRWTRREVS